MWRGLHYLCAVAALGTALSQTTPEPETVFRTDSRLVVLNVSVTDTQGRMVTELPQNTFRVFENDAQQQIRVFRREDIPISLGLLVDRSPSMLDKREKVATAAVGLIRASNPADEVFVLNFDDNAYLDQDFTSDIGKLERALRLFDSKGGTAMRDAMRLAAEHLRHRAGKEKKVILVVTDGEDNSSLETIQHLVKVAQQNEILVYAVGLLGQERPDAAARAHRDLDSLTQATGGRAWYPRDISEIDGIARQIAHEIRNQYILGYNPGDQTADGSFRRVRVEVAVPNVIVRTRSGYYATPRAQK